MTSALLAAINKVASFRTKAQSLVNKSYDLGGFGAGLKAIQVITEAKTAPPLPPSKPNPQPVVEAPPPPPPMITQAPPKPPAVLAPDLTNPNDPVIAAQIRQAQGGAAKPVDMVEADAPSQELLDLPMGPSEPMLTETLQSVLPDVSEPTAPGLLPTSGGNGLLPPSVIDAGVELDKRVNALLGGSVDETISSRAGRGAFFGPTVSSALCGGLDLLDPGHCHKASTAHLGRVARSGIPTGTVCLTPSLAALLNPHR